MDTASVAITVVVGLLGALVGAIAVEAWRQWQARRPLRGILGFNRDHDVIIVYPPRPGLEEPILPQIATEDFMAINNVQRLIMASGWSADRTHMKDAAQCQQIDKQRNVVTICCTRRNTVTRDALDKLASQLEAGFEDMGDRERKIVFYGGEFNSPTFRQVKELLEQGREVSAGPLEDFALVVNTANPWNPKTTMLLVAGIRGIGTWGAANHLRRHARDVGRRTKTGRFAMVVRVRYENWDIVRTQIVNFQELS